MNGKIEITAYPSRKYKHQIPDTFEKINQDDSYLIIGKLAVENKFISEEKLEEALFIQEQRKRDGQNLFLGEIMVLLGMMSQSQLDSLLLVQKVLETEKLDSRFGQIAVKNTFATRREFNQALEAQKKIFEKTKPIKLIGDILVGSGVLTAEQRDVILFKQKRISNSILISNCRCR